MKPWNIKNVITPVNLKRGAPMGRPNIGTPPHTVTSGKKCTIFKKHQTKVYKKHVKLSEGYDKEGAYWGTGRPLYVYFTADLSYIEFKRL